MLAIKIGGSLFGREGAISSIAQELSALKEQFVLVHGGASSASSFAEKLGIAPEFVISPSGFRSRRTTKEVMELFAMVLLGKVNKGIVCELQKRKINALGLCGADGRLISAGRKTIISVEEGKEKIIRDDYTGKIREVNAELLRSLLQSHITPVIAPIAISEESELLNIDADRCASAVAASLCASKLIILTDVDGYFENFPHDFVPSISSETLPHCMEKAQGGMKKKLLAAKEALSAGVGEVILANGTVSNPIKNALSGRRTLVVR